MYKENQNWDTEEPRPMLLLFSYVEDFNGNHASNIYNSLSFLEISSKRRDPTELPGTRIKLA